ncbi:bifunctional phosphopantothenoylcysteine decarboxylase/phosphopantothenate--cysteine ligase CoaBC [Naumannella halotolerans]|uniref:Coenzyme A biosynthesis bifunctional protein CoaBC n=1 Tax=Naumannella halotolerans TaxID=993414 RepID=A0A4R7JAN4_9ACTN|nr:bifunctional phosphopantothenoylcysteine decarboxylase/phosphopantothenate--cysteine ligase CoaBC [Naumannella halotolerans]TDT33459.1 phosphopantothenoylcysteine decarboxylase/phosphopantothenate--cysteine ligase [Naumannella halotolerans]
MSRILLGVAGGIAAYKACELLRRFSEAGHEVTVVPTPAALNFVGKVTWEALSGRPVATEVFSDAHRVNHVMLGRQADLVVVAPATADLLARAAQGRADDLLTNVLLTAHCPVMMAPAMHTEMWQHAATRSNVQTQRERGVVVVDPASGRLTGADSGPGRLPDPDELAQIAEVLLEDPSIATRGQDLHGRTVVVSAGGTREPLDPVRYLGNSSSGRMGMALARAARLRGARVRLVRAHTEVATPSGVDVVDVGTTAELDQAMSAAVEGADLVVMAVAAADFTPARTATGKIKKDRDSGLTLELQQTTDVLARLGAGRSGGRPTLVGFAAETAADPDRLLELGRSKLARKKADWLVLNDVSGGKVFGSEGTAVTVIGSDGSAVEAAGSKELCAHRILDVVSARSPNADAND